MKAMRNDDFNTILELKMRGYQPSENTTKIYLASLDTSQVDKANDIILKSL